MRCVLYNLIRSPERRQDNDIILLNSPTVCCSPKREETCKLKTGGRNGLIYAPASGSSHQHFVSPLTTFSQLTARFWPGPVHCRGLRWSLEGAIWPLCWIQPAPIPAMSNTVALEETNCLIIWKVKILKQFGFTH